MCYRSRGWPKATSELRLESLPNEKRSQWMVQNSRASLELQKLRWNSFDANDDMSIAVSPSWPLHRYSHWHTSRHGRWLSRALCSIFPKASFREHFFVDVACRVIQTRRDLLICACPATRQQYQVAGQHPNTYLISILFYPLPRTNDHSIITNIRNIKQP